ncbi:hypothetical protein [Deinococcus ruber]|uniref:Uncharacterized protein n=1 Tax=Deinococcus ruber TaxID=1848197 RepID=A0A918C294_9DEIO|nr:hypothetical protein [Deinococcus ruber]GGR00318.1 hypothetical protein GCM10008957_11360 [Deinococcus ruber]
MTSPMNAPSLHDNFVLLDGAKRRPLPGAARVTVGLTANVDTQQPAADSTEVTQITEATAEITVQLLMWTHEQWMAYQSLLAVFRAGTKTGPAVFTTTHPEVRARRVKRLYFISEQSEPYSPATGYRASIKFSEKLANKSSTQSLGTTTASVDTALGVSTNPETAATPAATAAGQKMRDAAIANGPGTKPALTRDGVHDVSEAGYCSSWERVVGAAAGLDPSLYGASAKETEGRFVVAKMSIPWSSAVQGQLQVGDQIFYGNDPSGLGHVGTYIGNRADGTPLVMSNNYVTYKARGGLFDAAGRATGYDASGKKVDARGTVPLTGPAGLGQPTSVGKPFKVTAVKAGPSQPVSPVKTVPPLPALRPSLSIPAPPAAAFRATAPSPSIIPAELSKYAPAPIFPGGK